MTIQEVRIGNLVHHPLFGDYTFIRATAFNGFYIGHPEGNAIHIDDFSPIKITDVLLEQMGFKYMEDHAPGIGNYGWWENDEISLTHVHEGLYGIEGMSIMKPLKYVHQLQNAYFVITGTELSTENVVRIW